MKVNGNTIKPGNVIEHKNGLWVAVKTSHVKPGKGGAFAQIELRNLKDGTKLNERFRSSENIERVILEEVPHVFLYKENNKIETATVTTAAPLDEALRAEVINFIKKYGDDNVELTEKVDEKIIGGAIIRMGDKQLDASVSKAISELRQTFNKNLYIQDF